METKIQNKKIYSKPLVEVIAVDYEISMQVVSSDDDNVPPGGGSNKSIDPSKSGPLDIYNPVSEEDVFGGSSPQF